MALAIRRGIATALALCVCMAFAEPVIADSCDADARAASTQPSGTRDGVVASATVAADVNDASPAPASNTGSATHSIHVCHCVHAHVAPLGLRQTLSSVPAYVNPARVMHSDLTPPSVVQEPQLRPPRTLSAI